MSRWLVLLALVCAPPLASAQPTPPTQPPTHAEKGRRFYELGKYREAIAEWEAAYEQEQERKPNILYNLAQAYRFLNEHERAIQLFRHYLDVRPDDPERANIEAEIEKLKVDKAAKLEADKAEAARIAAVKAAEADAAAKRAAADQAAAELAKQTAVLAGLNKHVRIAVDVGVSIVRLEGLDTGRSPQLGGRIGVSWIKRLGTFSLDLGGSWQLTTIPYTEVDTGNQLSVFYSQLHGTAALTHKIVGPVWGRVGIGIGLSNFNNLRKGNPVIDMGERGEDTRQACGRVDTLIGYRYDATLDFVLTLGSFSVAGTNDDLDPRIKKIVTLEGGWIGVYIKI